MTQSTSSKHPFLAEFTGLERELAGRGPSWLREMRRKGTSRFEQLGFPTTKLEEWRATNVAPIARGIFQPAPRNGESPALDDLPEAARLNLGGPRLVFLDGRFAADLSSVGELPEGLWVGNLAEALERIPERVEPHLCRPAASEATAFEALNDALTEDGAVVLVADGLEFERPIQLLFVSHATKQPTASAPRTLIVAGRGSRASIVEIYAGHGEGHYLTNAVTDVELGDNAALEHYRIQLEGPGGYHISHNRFRQGRDSRYAHHNINLGGKLVRNDVGATLNGEGGWCRLNGFYLTGDKQHVDNHTRLDHAKPHCDSHELYKGILAGKSRTVFNGRIVVHPDAQKTDAKQSNQNVLLSPDALAHTRPQLEIYADDVRCTHGATIGRLDQEAIFYLQSRGLSADAARELLLAAFAGELLEQIEPEPLRTSLEQAVAQRLQALRDGTGETS